MVLYRIRQGACLYYADAGREPLLVGLGNCVSIPPDYQDIACVQYYASGLECDRVDPLHVLRLGAGGWRGPATLDMAPVGIMP